MKNVHNMPVSTMKKKMHLMSELPACPKCQSPYVYEDGGLLICPECAYQWSKDANNE